MHDWKRAIDVFGIQKSVIPTRAKEVHSGGGVWEPGVVDGVDHCLVPGGLDANFGGGCGEGGTALLI